MMDWESPESLDHACSEADAVVHLAGMNAQTSRADAATALEFNGRATAGLVAAAVRQGVKRFVYVSTARVYGHPLAGTITEDTALRMLDPYATSHRAGEEATLRANEQRKMSAVVVRLSNSFGAPAHPDADCWTLLINDLCRQAVTQRRMNLRSSGQERRNFIPMTDACRAIQHLLQWEPVHPQRDIFNVGGMWSPTVWEAATFVQEQCAHRLGFSPTLMRPPLEPSPESRLLDFRSDALYESGFRPVNDRDGEIDALIAFCESHFTT
jgi:UDP-glucose 4-epimerase